MRWLIAERRYLPSSVHLLKEVVAVAGDSVCFEHERYLVNGQLLFDRRYIKETRRQITSTSTGRALIRALPDVATQPDMTALWEATLRRIHDGEVSLESFLDAVRKQLRELVNRGMKTGALDLRSVSSSSAHGIGRRMRRGSTKRSARHS